MPDNWSIVEWNLGLAPAAKTESSTPAVADRIAVLQRSICFLFGEKPELFFSSKRCIGKMRLLMRNYYDIARCNLRVLQNICCEV